MPPSTYLLDNNIVSYFFNAGLKAELSRIGGTLPLAVVREVHEEACRHPNKGAEYAKWQAIAPLAVRDLLVGGVGSTCLGLLRSNTGSLKDLGEHASIAATVDDSSLIFVCNDQNALWIALRELFKPGEHVVRFSTFLRRAHETVGLRRSVVEKLAKLAQFAHAPPTWWTDWLATLPP
jgi:hypothetical protein